MKSIMSAFAKLRPNIEEDCFCAKATIKVLNAIDHILAEKYGDNLDAKKAEILKEVLSKHLDKITTQRAKETKQKSKLRLLGLLRAYYFAYFRLSDIAFKKAIQEAKERFEQNDQIRLSSLAY